MKVGSLLEARVVGPVPAGVAGAPELAEPERPQAGGGVAIVAEITDDNEFNGLLRRRRVVRFDIRCGGRIWPTHSGAS